MKPYTAIGYWKDDPDEPVVIQVIGARPFDAACIAAFMAKDWTDKERDIASFHLVQVIEGHHKGELGDGVIQTGEDLIIRFFEGHEPKDLPMYLGITDSLDQAIERKLK